MHRNHSNTKQPKTNPRRSPKQQDWRAKLHDNEKKIKPEDNQPFVFQRPLTVKPGTVSTLMMLSVLGGVIAPAGAVLVPHVRQPSKDELQMRDLIQSKMIDGVASYSSDVSPCKTFVVDEIAKVVSKNSAIKQRAVKVLEKSVIYCSSTPEIYPEFRPGTSLLVVSSKPHKFNTLSRTFREAELFYMHQTQNCPAAYAWQAIVPVYPFSNEAMNAYLTAFAAGDHRILTFKELLSRFKRLDVDETLRINESLDSADKRLSIFDRLIYRYKLKERLNFTAVEIDTLKTYINASRNCFKQTTLRQGDALPLASNKEVEFIFDADTNIHFEPSIHVRGQEKQYKYLHTFDAVAHLVDDVRDMLAKVTQDPWGQLKWRDELTISGLSDEALQVFYPEVRELMLAEEKKCMPESVKPKM